MADQQNETTEAKFARETWGWLSSKFDVDKSGGISVDEIKNNPGAAQSLSYEQAVILVYTFREINLMRNEDHSVSNAPITKADIEAVSKRVVFSQTDFDKAMKPAVALQEIVGVNEQTIQDAFKKIDGDGNKNLTFAEMMERNQGSTTIRIEGKTPKNEGMGIILPGR